MTLTGAADAHAEDDDVENLSVFFNDAAFTNGLAEFIVNSAVTDLMIEFFDPIFLNFDPTTGSVVEGETISLSVTCTHNISGSVDFVLTGDFTYDFDPAELNQTIFFNNSDEEEIKLNPLDDDDIEGTIWLQGFINPDFG